MDKFYPSLHHYAFRLHTDLSSLEVFERIKAVFKKPVKKIDYQYSVVCGREIEATRVHSQSYLVFAMPPKTLLQRLKDEFKFSGNKDYSFVKVKDPVNYLAYVLKEGDVHYTLDLEEEVQNSPDWVPMEESIANFNESYKLLSEQYLSTEMSDYNFMLKLLELYADYNKNIYTAHIRAQWLGLANKRNKPFNKAGFRISGNSRPFRHILIEEIFRGFCIFDN